MTNTDDDFYPTLGPLLSRREIAKELGSPVWDDDDKVWQVAVAKGGDVLGFVAVRDDSEVCSFYVTPGSRGLSVGYALLARAAGTEGSMKATASESSRELFIMAGFRETGRRGRFYSMRRDGA